MGFQIIRGHKAQVQLLQSAPVALGLLQGHGLFPILVVRVRVRSEQVVAQGHGLSRRAVAALEDLVRQERVASLGAVAPGHLLLIVDRAAVAVAMLHQRTALV